MTDSKIKSALDAAGTAADYSARATYQRGYDAGVASVASETSNRHTGDSMTDWSDEKITALMANEADRCASRIVAALDRGNLPTGNSDVESAIKRAIQRVEARADAAEARAEAAEARAEVAIARACEAVEAREWALGVQVVAQAERLRLAEVVVEAARALVSRTAGRPRLADYVAVHKALAAYDAVPGDDDKETT